MRAALVLVLMLASCAAEARLEHSAPARGYEPTVPITVRYLPRAELPAACNQTPERLVGCSLLWPGLRCEIIIAEGLGPQLTDEVMKHERAHCGGWWHED